MKLMKTFVAVIFGATLWIGASSFTPMSEKSKNQTVAQNELTTIKQFLAMLDGTEKAAEAAIAKFGSADVIANGMIPYGKNPTIVSTDGNCCLVSLDYEDEANEYTLCEENGKITTFEMYFGDEEED